MVFLDPALKKEGTQLIETYPNVRVEYLCLDFVPENVQLPERRNCEKDSAMYLWIQCQKLEILKRALEYTNRPYLAWVDFRLFHIFEEQEAECKERLRQIELYPWTHTKILAPGCWNAGRWDIWNQILWRFCGGFLLAPRASILPAAVCQRTLVLGNLPRLTWEVNYWTRMEEHFEWYKGDHNPTILPKMDSP